MKRAILTIIAASIALSGSNAFAQSLIGAPIDPEPNSVTRPSDAELACAPKNRHMITMSVPGDRSIKNGCSIAFDFDKIGRVEDIRLLRSSGKSELDFDCVSAILGSAPFEPNEQGDRKNVRYTFGGRDLSADSEGIKAVNRTQRSNFLAKTGSAQSDYFISNIIPISLGQRYPGIFTDEELCDDANLRLIPKTFFASNNEPTFASVVANKRFRTFYERWNTFVSDHKNPTKVEIEKFRDEVSSEFSDMFAMPPNSISKSK